MNTPNPDSASIKDIATAIRGLVTLMVFFATVSAGFSLFNAPRTLSLALEVDAELPTLYRLLAEWARSAFALCVFLGIGAIRIVWLARKVTVAVLCGGAAVALLLGIAALAKFAALLPLTRIITELSS